MKEATSIMTAGSVKPILVLAVGNQLLSDDGVGMVLLDELSRDLRGEDCVEFVDGGTQGLALLGQFTGREAVVMLDAIAMGAAPGTIHSGVGLPACSFGSGTSHDANATELLRFAALVGELPPRVHVIGVEPEIIRTGIGLSSCVSAAIPAAVQKVKTVIQGVKEGISCASQCQAAS